MSAFMRALSNAFCFSDNLDEGELTRMFRIEYAAEYKNLKQNGVAINDCTVKKFLQDLKKHN
jgi:hypothetical protein